MPRYTQLVAELGDREVAALRWCQLRFITIVFQPTGRVQLAHRNGKAVRAATFTDAVQIAEGKGW